MSDTLIGSLGILSLLILIAANMHIGIALILVSYVGLIALVGASAAWGMMEVVPYTFISNWTLSSVPMFVFMGYIRFSADLTRGLFDATRLWLARLPGGACHSVGVWVFWICRRDRVKRGLRCCDGQSGGAGNAAQRV